MPDKPDLAEVAEALGGQSSPSTVDAKFQADRAAFEKIEAKYNPPKKAKKPKAEKVEAVEEAKEEAQPQEAESVTEDAPEVVEGKGKDEDTPESAKAREFLRLRESVPSSVIEKLSAEEAVDWAASASKGKAEVDKAFMERAEFQKELRDLKEGASKPEEPAVPASVLDLEGIQSQLSEQFGEEESKVLAGVLKNLVTPLEASLQSRIAELESTIDDAKESNAEQIASTNRERLTAIVPLLGESNPAWEAVERTVIALLEKDPSAFPNASEAFDEAIRSHYGAKVFDEKPAAPAVVPDDENTKEEKAEREKATPTTETKRTSPRKLPPKESDWQVFRHLNAKPGDIRGAQRAGQVG